MMTTLFEFSALALAAALLLVAILQIVFVAFKADQQNLPYPPGPEPKFLLGNALDLPKVNAGQVYAEWGKKFQSDIIHATALGNHVVVVNSRAIAEDLFEKRSHLYNDRPVVPVVKILGWEFSMGLLKYGDTWRKYRRLCQQNLNREASTSYYPLQTEKVHNLLRGFLDEPEKFDEHNKMLSVSITLSMMYGYEVKTLDDPVIKVADESLTLGVGLLVPGATLINVLPFLRHIPPWVPGATAQKQAAEVKRLTQEMKSIPMEYVKMAMADGMARSSFVTDFLETKGTTGASEEEEDMVNNIAYTIYGAASDTTIGSTGTFLHLIATHPEIQRKAQAEIDSVVGNHRLPNFADRASMPYLEAIYREVMRYNPPMHIGVPHALLEDDIYDGYFIPKGTTVISNIWAMTHDERVYSEPDAFRPERFFDAEGKLNDDSQVLAYGFGRRVCCGKYVASATMWLTIACVLACFNIGAVKDGSKVEIEIDEKYDDYGLVNHKRPFKCSIIPRSDQARKLIEATTD